ncbi:MAG TPA: sigma-70 family RNA polymerase sigma factor [Bryobacteraceae bacterium]
MLEIFDADDYLNEGRVEHISTAHTSQDDLYKDAVEKYGPSLERLASAYETDPEKRRDLSQDIHFQLWRSFRQYDGRCSLRTWIYRVAHNVGASYVMRQKRTFSALVSLEVLETLSDTDEGPLALERHVNLERLSTLIHRLKPLSRQVIVCWLEGMDAASIAEITGLSPANVAVRVSRIKGILAHRFSQGGSDAE